jgi:hypothetical protein
MAYYIQVMVYYIQVIAYCIQVMANYIKVMAFTTSWSWLLRHQYVSGQESPLNKKRSDLEEKYEHRCQALESGVDWDVNLGKSSK